MRPPWRPHPLRRLIALCREVLERLLMLEIVDRALVVGAQAFSALIPLLIVTASIDPGDGPTFADKLIERLDIEGEGARVVRQTFAAPADGTTVTIFGALLVVFSALAFTRALQRTFELTWGLARRGMKSTGWGLLWLAFLVAYGSLVPVLQDNVDGTARLMLALIGSFGMWLVTPYILLARRLPWRRLVVQALLTAVGMTIASACAALYVPRAITSAADQFGAIGVAFTMLTLLWGAGLVIVVAAALGAAISLRSWPASPGSVTPRSSSSSVAPSS